MKNLIVLLVVGILCSGAISGSVYAQSQESKTPIWEITATDCNPQKFSIQTLNDEFYFFSGNAEPMNNAYYSRVTLKEAKNTLTFVWKHRYLFCLSKKAPLGIREAVSVADQNDISGAEYLAGLNYDVLTPEDGEIEVTDLWNEDPTMVSSLKGGNVTIAWSKGSKNAFISFQNAILEPVAKPQVFVPDDADKFLADFIPGYKGQDTTSRGMLANSYKGSIRDAADFNIEIFETFPFMRTVYGFDPSKDVYVYLPNEKAIMLFGGDIFMFKPDGSVQYRKGHLGTYGLLKYTYPGAQDGIRATFTMLNYVSSEFRNFTADKGLSYQPPIFHDALKNKSGNPVK